MLELGFAFFYWSAIMLVSSMQLICTIQLPVSEIALKCEMCAGECHEK